MIETLSRQSLVYDICIVGAGPAGLTLASQLAYCGLRVCVLESGHADPSPLADSLKEVEFDGLPIKSSSRERIVGGASQTWDGRSAPLDAIDFEPRGWPGWPISRDEMFRYLPDTVRYRFPAPRDFEVESAVSPGRWGPWEDLAIKMFVAVRPPYRFNSLKSVFQREGLDLWTGATVTHLKSRPGGNAGRTVTAAVCRTVAGHEAEVTATHFVLATGGIENARVLLNSPAGASSLGNEYDQVGRYFMNHPKGSSGVLRLSRPLPRNSPYIDQAFGPKVKYAGLHLAPEIQRTRGLLNSYVAFQPHTGLGRDILVRIDSLRARTHDSERLQAVARFFGHQWRWMAPPVRTLRLRWFLEMEPRATNRVTLGNRPDAFGNPLPHVHYELSERDRATLRALHTTVYNNIARLNLGRLESTPDEVLAATTLDASHHLGSTRMGAAPETSVVDRNCKVHNATNLYIAGGSVFSSGGCANPTLTIVALAMRLALHLQSLSTPVSTAVFPRRPGRAPIGIVLIGAGRRVTSDVVPSLESHDHRFDVVGIYARTTASVFTPQRRHEVQPVHSLDDNALAATRFIYVGVPREAVLPVLHFLRRWSSRELILDTPVPTSQRALSILGRFKRVHVAEDCAYLPWLDALRSFWAANRLTGPLHIECDRSAFRYHAVALAKALCGTAETPGTVVAAERKAGIFSICLTNGTATIREPRDYSAGTLRVSRDGVTVSSHRADGVIAVEMLSESGLCVGFDIGGTRVRLSRPESLLIGKLSEGDSIVSRMGELKRVGLARMFAMMAEGKEPWRLLQGLDDSKVDEAGERT